MTYSSLSDYKQQILNDFNSRTNYENEFHTRAARRLVQLSKLQSGQQVLDIATGTGLAAIAAAMVVGSTGSVLGTDFALGMLQQAKQKIGSSRIFRNYVLFGKQVSQHSNRLILLFFP
ncbi:class I SAM-dependent methyltransferase [Nostoc sp. CCY0012]|uniref:class I SAM-dependent methyltransferase n=1 Tax=Nostoc sp. CCY0012 TaxID=1056123 RepID=UPI0039C66AA1